VRLWFWAWVIVAAGIAAGSALARDRSSAPFAVGAACAAALEAAGGTPGVEWLVFAGVSSVVFVAVNRKRHRRRHARTGGRRHGAGEARG
jgi:membrane protein implicated in regulation of membrane protease activity